MSKELAAMTPEQAQEYMNKLMGQETIEFDSPIEAVMYEKFKEMAGLRGGLEQRLQMQRKQIEEGEGHFTALTSQLNVVGNLLIETEDARLAEKVEADKAAANPAPKKKKAKKALKAVK